MVKSLFALHVERWSGCTACRLHEGRVKVVLARGRVPADLLFVGEAPGVSEDVVGAPFVGPAGQLLDQIVEAALPLEYADGEGQPPTGYLYSTCFANLICCIPYDESGEKVHEPPDWAVRACAGRLRELVEIVRPRLIVCVGGEARDWLDPRRKGHVELPPIPQVSIVHPAAILRANVAAQGLMARKAEVTIRNAIQEHL